MAEPNVAISESAREFADRKAREAGLESAGAYLEALVERARRRDEARDRVERLLIEGLESGPAAPLTPEDWEAMRREAMERIASRTRAR